LKVQHEVHHLQNRTASFSRKRKYMRFIISIWKCFEK